jgi:hypothetical protein
MSAFLDEWKSKAFFCDKCRGYWRPEVEHTDEECAESLREDARYALDPITEALWGDQGIFDQLSAERRRQHEKFGQQDHKDGTSIRNKHLADEARRACDGDFRRGHGSWNVILMEEVFEAIAEEEPEKLREELLQVAAVAIAWIEAIDRRTT